MDNFDVFFMKLEIELWIETFYFAQLYGCTLQIEIVEPFLPLYVLPLHFQLKIKVYLQRKKLTTINYFLCTHESNYMNAFIYTEILNVFMVLSWMHVRIVYTLQQHVISNLKPLFMFSVFFFVSCIY